MYQLLLDPIRPDENADWIVINFYYSHPRSLCLFRLTRNKIPFSPWHLLFNIYSLRGDSLCTHWKRAPQTRTKRINLIGVGQPVWRLIWLLFYLPGWPTLACWPIKSASPFARMQRLGKDTSHADICCMSQPERVNYPSRALINI